MIETSQIPLHDIYPPEIAELSAMPLADVVLNDESLNGMNNMDEFVGIHEFGHGILAYGMGVKVSKLTIIPSPGEYRGVTVLEGLPSDLKKLQLISAGGAAAVKSREGAGSDFEKNDVIHRYYGGYSPEEAFVVAQSLLSSISDEEWKMIGKILFVKKTITGDEIPKVLERARWELKMQQSMPDRHFSDMVIARNTYEGSAEITHSRETVIEPLADGFVRKYVRVNGFADLNSELVYCGECGEKEQHKNDCTNRNRNMVVIAGNSTETIQTHTSQFSNN